MSNVRNIEQSQLNIRSNFQNSQIRSYTTVNDIKTTKQNEEDDYRRVRKTLSSMISVIYEDRA